MEPPNFFNSTAGGAWCLKNRKFDGMNIRYIFADRVCRKDGLRPVSEHTGSRSAMPWFPKGARGAAGTAIIGTET